MLAERLAHPAQAASSPTAALRQALAGWWWLLRLHMADLHGLPRGKALEPPPARWLEGLIQAPACQARPRAKPWRPSRPSLRW